jgi:Bifunctional DNA primase/polymerase, N-terminal
MGDTSPVLQAALEYIEVGWHPIPIPRRSKRPVIEGWPNLEITAESVHKYFNGAPQNIGVLLGANCTDVDIDSPEAIACAAHFLPPTPAMFGRGSKRYSHWLYKVADFDSVDKAKISFIDPCPGDNKSTLVELRLKGGHQTVMPPSVHESGEPIQWEEGWPAVPAEVAFLDLRRSVAKVAAASLLARHMPPDRKIRLKAFRVLAGFLSRWHTPPEQVWLFAVAITAAGGFDRKLANEARTTALSYCEGANVPGYPELVVCFGEQIVNTIVG